MQHRPTRILLLEDSPEDEVLVRYHLELAEMADEVHLATNREEFERAVQEVPYDILLSDYFLPDINGQEATRLSTSRNPAAPVIIVTGSTNERTAVECMQAGAADYVLKTDLRRLAPAITNALERRGLEETATRSLRRERSLTRLLSAVRRVQRLIVRAGDRQQLIDEGCATLVEMLQYEKAWILLVDDDGQASATGSAGFAEGAGPTPMDFADEAFASCVTPLLESGAPQLINPTPEQCLPCPLGKTCSSCERLAVRLEHQGRVYGLLVVVLGNAMLPGEEGFALFQELGQDLSFALYRLDLEEQREEAFQRAAESEERYTRLLGTMSEVVFEVSTEGTILYLSPGIRSLTSLPVESLVGRDFRSLFPGADHSHFLRALEAAETLETATVEFPIPLSEETHWLSATISAMRQNGLLTGIRGVARDVTHQRLRDFERKEAIARLRKALGGTIQAIMLTVETRDPYTAGHQRRVADLSRAIAATLGLDRETAEGIRIAASIHDLGKIAIPSELLSKPGRLSDVEFSLVRGHPETSYDILKHIDFPWPVAQAVHQHHERLDGSGYPLGLVGDDIILEARIIAVADVIEAMVSHRPYRAALPIEAALEEITGKAGTLYDTDVAAAAVRLFREGSFELS